MIELKKVLMTKFDWSENEAQNSINEARNDLMNRLDEGEMPYDICSEYWGLEPDYLMDLV